MIEMGYVIFIIVVCFVVWCVRGNKKDNGGEQIYSTKEQECIDRNHYAYEGASIMAKNLTEKGYAVSEPKYQFFPDSACCGTMTVHENDKAIGEIWFSCYTDIYEKFGLWVGNRNEKNKGKYYHAICLGGNFRNMALLSTELRATEDVPDWLRICAGFCHFVEHDSGGLEGPVPMERWGFSDWEASRYLNVLFRKADYSNIENKYQLIDYYMNL
jgi:hypothetical protein